MSHRSVEQVIGRLATDEEFRRRFAASPETALQELIAGGLALTPVEYRVLVELNCPACEQFAKGLDPRIQKISLRKSDSSS